MNTSSILSWDFTSDPALGWIQEQRSNIWEVVPVVESFLTSSAGEMMLGDIDLG
jgi:hypothetical protein